MLGELADVSISPVVGCRGGNVFDEVAPRHRRQGLGLAHKLGVVGYFRADHAVDRTSLSDMAGQSASVNIGDAHNALASEIFVQRLAATKITRQRAKLLDNERSNLNFLAVRLDIFRGYAIITDERIGHRHNLSSIGRVGENLLITSHACVENHLARAVALCSEGQACHYKSVSQGQLAYFAV